MDLEPFSNINPCGYEGLEVVQIKDFKESSIPVICDMSSDIFSRVLDFSKFDLIYAGAQKNMGPAGTTIVIVKEDVLGKVTRQIPSMMNYQLMINKDSMFKIPKP